MSLLIVGVVLLCASMAIRVVLYGFDFVRHKGATNQPDYDKIAQMEAELNLTYDQLSQRGSGIGPHIEWKRAVAQMGIRSEEAAKAMSVLTDFTLSSWGQSPLPRVEATPEGLKIASPPLRPKKRGWEPKSPPEPEIKLEPDGTYR
jgi:hypothetical protein